VAFTPCCALTTRDGKTPWSQKLVSCTGLVHFDVDGVDDPDALKAQLAQHAATVFAFTSPRGNGVKVGIAATGITDPDTYKHVWGSVVDFMRLTYPTVTVSLDEHVKYLHALCYMSWDPTCYRNPDATPLRIPPPAPPTPARPRPRTPDTHDDYSRIMAALYTIPNHDASYDDWLEMGMALHSTGQPWAREVWEGWSRQSDKYHEGKQAKSWRSFTADGKTTIGTLFHRAKEHGWRPPVPQAGLLDQFAVKSANGHRAVPDMTQGAPPPGAEDTPQPETRPGPQTRAAALAEVWGHAITAEAFLAQQDEDVQADVRDLLVAGCITLLAAPRASGKTLIALFLGLALAQGGRFRDEQLPTRRVLLVDRDNPPALIRKRLRWLGAHTVTGLKVLTREKAPPLTDADAWAAFPVDHYDVVIVDSIGASTEGVSEKEGKQTQQYLATLKDLAQRGPAILALDNTNKAAQNYRGRGEKGDAVDILYEARNITGWTPSQSGEWWEELPDFGEHTWQQRASRRKGQQVLRIAFIPSKFRLGMEPDPFALEIDTRQEPWTLTDCTAALATAGEEAAALLRLRERATLRAAEAAVVNAIRARESDRPLLKTEATALVRACGVPRKAARVLVEQGGNRDVSPDGHWVLRPIPDHPTGKAIGVYLAGEEDDGKRYGGNSFPTPLASSTSSPFADGSTPSGKRCRAPDAAIFLKENTVDLLPPPGKPTAEGGWDEREEIRGPQSGGDLLPPHTFTSTDPEATRPCLVCEQAVRWDDHGTWRCVVCWPPPQKGGQE
jgi:hypothetical protein